jgi:hypothetical protein
VTDDARFIPAASAFFINRERCENREKLSDVSHSSSAK